MAENVFEILEVPHIIVEECLGNLVVRGADESNVTVRTSGDEESMQAAQDGDTIVVTASEDCRITCPAGSELTLRATRGNLRVKDVDGKLTIGEVNGNADLRGTGAAHEAASLAVQSVHGDLRLRTYAGAIAIEEVNGNADLRETGAAKINRVHGDLRAREIDGDFAVDLVSSDASVREVQGQVKLGRIGSDLKADALWGGLVAEGVGSDVVLGPEFGEAAYHLTAGSDLVVKLHEGANASFVVQAASGVHARVPDLVLQEEGGVVEGALGEGGPTIEATVGGSAVIKLHGQSEDFGGDFDFDFDFDFDPDFLEGLNDLGTMISARVSEAMADLDVRLQEKLQYFDSDKFREHIDRVTAKVEHVANRAAERAREVAERETERATEHARRAAGREAERARMRADRAERRWQRASGYRAPTPPTPPTAPAAPTPPAPPETSAQDKREERLQVLRMVEEGKLSTDEAAKLLAALR